MECKNKLTKIQNLKCSNIILPKRSYTFENGKCFCDGQLLGIIKEIEENKITVEHKNGSFADGTIMYFFVNN